MPQVVEWREVSPRASPILGTVTQEPCWRKRALPGSDAFEPVIEVLVTLTGGSGWPGPVVVRLNVTRLDVGVCTTCGLGVDALARETMREFLDRSNGIELLRLKTMRMNPPRGAALEALEIFGQVGKDTPLFGLPPAEYYSENTGLRAVRAVTRRKRLSKGQEVEYVGEERTPRVEPFGSAREIWVETEESEGHDDVYLFSCRMSDGRWEMGQPGYGRHFRPRTNQVEELHKTPRPQRIAS